MYFSKTEGYMMNLETWKGIRCKKKIVRGIWWKNRKNNFLNLSYHSLLYSIFFEDIFFNHHPTTCRHKILSPHGVPNEENRRPNCSDPKQEQSNKLRPKPFHLSNPSAVLKTQSLFMIINYIWNILILIIFDN